MNFHKKTLSQYQQAIRKIKKIARSRIFLLNGELGVGKTTFVKYFLDDEEVVSPTFSFCVEYKNAFHFDCYSNINYNAIMSALEQDKYIFIEWADRISVPIPGHKININRFNVQFR